MLPLDSPKWSELDTVFGKPKDVPKVLAEWSAALGFDQAATIDSRDLVNLDLHQPTITNLAFAVVPWLVHHCPKCEPAERAEYLIDVADVERNRLLHGVHFVRDGGRPEPDWLMPDYHAAIQQAQTMAEDLLDEPLPEEVRLPLWELIPALFGNAHLAQKRRHGQ